jgi:glycerol-3-phosphate acyltransferase PlsX
MASALLRMGRLPGVVRPAIATPIPHPGGPWPTVLLDSGANAECTPAMLVQFAQMGAAFARKRRYGNEKPRVALLSIGEEKSKGTPLEKETHVLLAEGIGGTGFDFVGNVEGRDFFSGMTDVIVTDGFTGNVALKTLEGSMRFLIGALTEILGRPERERGR